MKPMVGIFHSMIAANGARKALQVAGITAGHMMLLTPETGSAELHTVSPEHPAGACDVKAGHVLGAAGGFAGGLLTGATVLLVMPGVGPILAVGALVATVLAGITVGATVGGLVQDSFTMALPPEEVFVYEEALRQKCTLLIVKPIDEHQGNIVRVLFERLGTERVNEIREHWWRGQRLREAAAYHGSDAVFAAHEVSYRHGFETALDVRARGKTYSEATRTLAQRHPAMYQDSVFRSGFERGQAYYQAMLAHDLVEHGHAAAATH
jgi:hypothetical protein